MSLFNILYNNSFKEYQPLAYQNLFSSSRYRHVWVTKNCFSTGLDVVNQYLLGMAYASVGYGETLRTMLRV